MSGTDLSLCGWRLRSGIPLLELPAWNADGRAPDVVVRCGSVPRSLSQVAADDIHGEMDPDGLFLLNEPGIARYLVREGSAVTVEAHVDAPPAMVRAHFFATILGVLCYRRELLPLHAAAVVVAGRAILLAGDRDLGKSTLAAAIALRGYPLLADDVAPVRWTAGDVPAVLPAVPCLRLTPTAMDALSVPRDAALAPAYGKAAIPGLAQAWSQPAPIAMIVHLNPATDAGRPRMVKLAGGEAGGTLFSACFRGGLAQTMGFGPTIFRSVARLAAQCPSYRLAGSRELAGIGSVADLILDTAATLEPVGVAQ